MIKSLAKILSIFPPKAMHILPPEMAHFVAMQLLKMGLVYTEEFHDKSLEQNVFGLNFKNPVGMAAGFDKDAEAIKGLLAQGFSHVEVGTVTPQPQSGNPKPRLFRLSEQKAIINRMGFNNKGLEHFISNLEDFQNSYSGDGIVGANIGKNKDTKNFIADYVMGFSKVYNNADYVTVNVSSPNTEGLRDLQHKQNLSELLSALTTARVQCEKYFEKHTPIVLKIAPDLKGEDKKDIAEIALEQGIDGLIVTNTTISRKGVADKWRDEAGGLSGRPLFEMSTQVLRDMYKFTEGKIPLIGVGGISNAEDAYAKIKAGASLVQIYSAFIYQGFKLVSEINEGLKELLEKDGYANISEAVGANAK